MSERQPIVVLIRRLLARPNKPRPDAILGRCEGAALAQAIELGARLERPVVAVAAGPAKREDHAMAIALRAGCDRAIRVYDRGVEELDYLGVAEILAMAVRKLDAHVVLCGDRSEEALAGATGPAVAERLHWPHLGAVQSIATKDKALIVSRRGATQLDAFEVRTPAVLCIARAPAKVDAPPEDDESEDEELAASEHRDRRDTARPRVTPPIKEIEEWTLADIDLDPRALAPRGRFESKPRAIRRAPGVIVSTPQALIERLLADRVLG